LLYYLGFANRQSFGRIRREGLTGSACHHPAASRRNRIFMGELMVECAETRPGKAMLAILESTCTFGCCRADELRRLIDAAPAPAH
jgi:hypothetical protein